MKSTGLRLRIRKDAFGPQLCLDNTIDGLHVWTRPLIALPDGFEPSAWLRMLRKLVSEYKPGNYDICFHKRGRIRVLVRAPRILGGHYDLQVGLGNNLLASACVDVECVVGEILPEGFYRLRLRKETTHEADRIDS